MSRARVLDPKGIGHYPDTELPGQVGNFAIAGHRTTYGKPFTDIQTLKTGDAIVIRTEGVWYVYEVTDSYIVKPNYIQAIRPDPYAPTAAPTKRYLTLTTCHPRYSAAERYIVHAELSYWAAVEDGVPPEIVGSATVQEAS